MATIAWLTCIVIVFVLRSMTVFAVLFVSSLRTPIELLTVVTASKTVVMRASALSNLLPTSLESSSR